MLMFTSFLHEYIFYMDIFIYPDKHMTNEYESNWK